MVSFYEHRKVAITGGLGFLGSNLAIELVRLGAEVTLIDAMLPMYGGNLFNVDDIKDKVKIHFKDIRDEKAMSALVREQDIIFHIANQTSHVDSMTDPFLDVDINCRGNLVFLEACRKENPDVKIIYAGTRAQYGLVESTPVTENHPLRPTDVYGVNKHAGEQYHMIYHRVYGLRTTSLRMPNVYGPRHQMKHSKYGIQNWLIRLAMDGEKITIFGDGLQMRDFNYVDDVIQAFLLVGSREETDGESFNLGSGSPISFCDMAKKIVQVVGSGEIVHVEWPEDRKKIETGDYIADFSKIEKALGWKPVVTIDSGLETTVAYYHQYKKYYW